MWSSAQNRRLTIGFTASVAAHFLVMLIQFAVPEMAGARVTSLDVILVNARHETAPKDPQALAQANLDAGGDSNENVRATSPLPPQEGARNGNDLFDMVKGQRPTLQQPQHEQVLTQPGSSVAIASLKPTEDKPSMPQPVTGSDAVNTEAMILRLQAEIAERERAHNMRPRIAHIGTRAKEYRFARYVETWRIKAERIGELHYPKEARGRLYDNLVISVSIKKDGSVEKIAFHRRSKYPVLNEAAVRIIRLGEPYAPFPPEIAKDTDVIEITRTWQFTNDNKIGIAKDKDK